MNITLSLTPASSGVFSNPIVWAAIITFSGVLLTVIVSTIANSRLSRRRAKFEQELAREKQGADQRLAERRLEDEASARREAALLTVRLRRAEFQRTTIVELQEQMHELIQASDNAVTAKIKLMPIPEEVQATLRAKNARTAILISRVADDELREQIQSMKQFINNRSDDPKTMRAEFDRAVFQYAALMKAIGAKLRELDREQDEDLSVPTPV